MVASRIEGRPSWQFGACMQRVAEAGRGVIVLLADDESSEQLLDSIDMALGRAPSSARALLDTYTKVGLGSQILKDLGVGKIHLMGAPIKYNAISGFDLEVLEYVAP